VFRSAGITELTSAAGRETHPGYLVRMGFEFDEREGRFSRSL